MWEAGSQDWSLCVEFAKVDGAEPQWQPWKLQLETQLEPRTLAIAPLERHICVCAAKGSASSRQQQVFVWSLPADQTKMAFIDPGRYRHTKAHQFVMRRGIL